MDFLKPDEYQPLANELFVELRSKVLQVLPSARVEHIGSSAVPGVISKGDLDIFVGVSESEFLRAIEQIRSIGFSVKQNSLRTNSLCPFESKAFSLDVGIQLVVSGSEFEFFLLFRDGLRQDAELRQRYNQLKLDSLQLEEDEYRHKKSNFIESVLRSARLKY